MSLGNASALEFPDEAFHFVVGAQVYSDVPDVGRALHEAARVLRTGGRTVTDRVAGASAGSPYA
jgi:ubiquinone/menaquinone biosynthesis C-methylase UbiE